MDLPQSSAKNLKENAHDASVLLVDDDRLNQMVASKFLSKWGINVMIANDGKEALELVLQQQFKIILMDLNMPEMDGAETTQRIRAMKGSYFQTVPILVFSALVHTKEKAIELGMTDYACKPLNPTELQTKINKYLNNMQTSNNETGARRLSIDFELYTDGDMDFKRELIVLMISNLQELEQSLDNAQAQSDSDIFRKTFHKVKPTISMVNDSELTDTLEILKDFSALESSSYQERKKQFHRLCKEIIQRLEAEIEADASNARSAHAA